MIACTISLDSPAAANADNTANKGQPDAVGRSMCSPFGACSVALWVLDPALDCLEAYTGNLLWLHA